MKFSGSDAAVSAAVLLGAAALMALFAMDMDRYSSRSGEKSLGTVVFKKLSATRKAPSGLGWESMRNNSPVYDADTLRTASFSEASVNFDDGTSLDVFANSMLKLDFAAKAKNLEFLSGEISVGSSAAGTSYTISSASGRIDVDKGAKATFSREADRLSVEVSRGSASFVREDGSAQAIYQNQELQVDVKSGEAKLVQRPIVPTSPEPNARLLCMNGGGARPSVGFAWILGNEGAAGSKADGARDASQGGRKYELEISRSKDFVEGVLKLQRSEASASLPVAASVPEAAETGGGGAPSAIGEGTWYWRVRDDRGDESPVRRFSLALAEPPRPVFPADGASYAYRRIKPEVRFAWTGMEEAGAYLFELSSDPAFAKTAVRTRSASTSLSVSDLGAGTWYWRVRPIHAYELLGAEPATEQRRLIIAKSEGMGAPRLSTPLDGSLYQVQNAEGLGLSFAWEPQAEAVSYELLVSLAKDLSAPIMTASASLPYIRLTGSSCAALRKAGGYYWGVRWKDKEGNLSPASAPRALAGVDGSIAVRLTFPPEGYRIADSLVSNTRFGWKTNVPARTVFQVAGDQGFSQVVYQETVTADTLIGKTWPKGNYWWRLRTFNADGSVFLESPARGFQVVEPFPGAVLQKPAPGATFYLRDRAQADFAWQPVERADYYKVALRSSADGYSAPVFDREFVEATSLAYRLGDLPSGTYRISIQAFAAASEKTTRIIGYIADSDFTYKRITRIRLVSPAEGAHLPGLGARRGETVFSFEDEDEAADAQVIVSADPFGQKVVARAMARSGLAKVGRLNPGVYFWTAAGSLAGFDVSAERRFSFIVEAPPPLPAPETVEPVRGAVIGAAELRDKRSIRLAWSTVPGATHYRIAVYAQGKKEPVLAKDMLRATEYEIDDLSILDRGDCAWTAEAQAYDQAGELEQGGLAGKFFFTIDLPTVKKAKPSLKRPAYGR